MGEAVYVFFTAAGSCGAEGPHVEISSVPNLVGRNRKRWFTFEGPNRLRLRVEPTEFQPGIADGTLIWERIQYADEHIKASPALDLLILEPAL
jgi:hypothetical protein